MSTYTPTHVRSDVSNTELPTDRELSVADTGAGLLVFADCDGVGRELVAFADVSDWDVIRSALEARGLGVGALGHLPEVDLDELPNDNGREEPTRSEPADFGLGESTGVQSL
jgi:hypothetical protein